MVPPDVDPLAWAETNLRVSPGATVRDTMTGIDRRIRTLVFAVREDHSCIHLDGNNRCDIHEVAPFGCAYFDCQPKDDHDNRLAAIRSIAAEQGKPDSLYARIADHLGERGLVVESPEVRKNRLREIAYMEDIRL